MSVLRLVDEERWLGIHHRVLPTACLCPQLLHPAADGEDSEDKEYQQSAADGGRWGRADGGPRAWSVGREGLQQ